MNKINGALAYDLPSTGPWAALVFLVSLNLRPSIAAVGPVLSQIGTGLHWAEGVQGVLTAIPLLAFAAVSPLVTFLARRIGIDMSILLALLCIAAGDAIRSFGGGVGIWLGTVVFASAIAVGNVLVPVIAKRDYAGHVAMATGVYSGCITAGSATAGLLSAPLAQMWAVGVRHSPSGVCLRWLSPRCGRCVSCTIAKSLSLPPAAPSKPAILAISMILAIAARRPTHKTRIPHSDRHVPRNRRMACSPACCAVR